MRGGECGDGFSWEKAESIANLRLELDKRCFQASKEAREQGYGTGTRTDTSTRSGGSWHGAASSAPYAAGTDSVVEMDMEGT